MFKIEKAERAPFEFEYDGKVYELPNFATLPKDDMFEMAAIDSGDLPKFAKFVDCLLNKYCAGCTKDMSIGQINDLFTAWVNEANAGEAKNS